MCANVFQHGGKFNRSNAQVDLAAMSCAQASNILDSALTTICKRYYVMNLRVEKPSTVSNLGCEHSLTSKQCGARMRAIAIMLSRYHACPGPLGAA